MSIDANTGAISGTPGSADVQTGVTVRVQVTDSGALTDEKTYTIDVENVNDPPAITNVTLPNATQGNTLQRTDYS